MPTIRVRIILNKVRSIFADWGMVFLNLFMSLLIAVVSYAGVKLDSTLDSINGKVGSIDTTTQLNAQHIRTIFDHNDRHEMADNKKFTEMERQIQELRRSLK